MFEGNCALKIDADDVLDVSRKITSDEVNNWLERNKNTMEKLTIEVPMDWAEALCTGG